jgi:homopolymeric O-antigen transport system ATP-binding protein
MTAPAIKVEAAGKWYELGGTAKSDTLLKGRLRKLTGSPARLLTGSGSDASPSRAKDGIWAVRDVSFEVHRGEALGLVGRNGAGKSTMLKLLSRITLPSEGRLEIRGRTATLLEVGTGFHPELTGRENIYLNGAILGMKRAEIAAKFDEIVEFSGVQRFIDTPVKRYSSGMFIRLGFAVAANLEPDVLLIDEVLAVGDADFQRKSLGKMREVASEGRTVVFVSHNLSAVQQLCSRAVLIEDGRLRVDDSPEKVVDAYLARTGARASGGVSVIPDSADRIGTGEARLRRVVIEDREGSPLDEVHLGEPFRVTATYEVFEPIQDAVFDVSILSSEGIQLVTAQSVDFGRPPADLSPGWHEVSAELSVTLLPHEYNIGVGVHRTTGATIDWVDRAHRLRALHQDRSGEDRYQWPEASGFVRPDSFFDVPRPVPPPESVPGDDLEYVAAAQPIRHARDWPGEDAEADGGAQR